MKKVYDICEKRKSESERPLLGDILKEANKDGRFYMGRYKTLHFPCVKTKYTFIFSGELTRLWNQCPNNLEACKCRERDFLPSIEEYFADAILQLESGTPVKDEDNLLKDGNYGWRALRLLARKSSHFFTYSNTIMNPLSSYLEMMVQKIASEKPGIQENNESQNEAELEESLLNEEDQNTEDLKQDNTEDFLDDNNPRTETKGMTDAQLQLFSSKVGKDWQKLAAKFGFKPDEIEWLKSEHPTDVDQARHLLKLWIDEDEDASLDNLLYILEGLEMSEAAEAVRTELGNIMDTS